MARRIFGLLALLAAGYLVIGLAFHLKWSSDRAVCRELRVARGEFVEPEIFGALGTVFTVTYWPVYAWANTYHFGDPFATPCTRP
ncbi:MAG: hypothetical protein NZM18_13325 [Thermoflexales bacterium]|nr:hypothetical protein [Thermoflexales bacterium]MDW8351656.1 hypothetical protein [Anaerolineae bacterium]